VPLFARLGHAKLYSVERLDADLLELTELDRDTGTIWFLYHRPLTTREQLPSDLERLQDLGWIERTPKDRWMITSAGSKALSAARNWNFLVDQISHVNEFGRRAIVIGRLLAGSLAFFSDPSCNGFEIAQSEFPERIGWITDVRPSEDPTGTDLIVSLEVMENGHLRRGDVLRFRQRWIGS
jgi:hypothetical protein